MLKLDQIFIEIFDSRKRKTDPHLIEVCQNTEHREGTLSLQNIITSTHSIYGKIIRLPLFGTKELATVQFSWELSPRDPLQSPMQGLSILSDLSIRLHIRVVKPVKISTQSEKVTS
jgi:hypothetical protein